MDSSSVNPKRQPSNDLSSFGSLLNQLSELNGNELTELPFYRTLFQTLIGHAPIGFYIIENGEYSYVNTYYCNLLGYTNEELIGSKVSCDKTIHPDDLPVLLNNIEKRRTGEKEGRYRVRKIRKDGTLIHAEIHASIANVFGKEILFGGIVDITEQVNVEQKLQESIEQSKSLFYNSPDAIYSFDDEGRFISANPACEQITGYSTKELLEMPFMPLIVSEDLPVAIQHFEEAKKGKSSSSDLILIRKDGSKIHINATHFPMKVNGKVTGTYGVARDITQKMLYDQQMEQFAFYDPLTQLPNRKLFEDRVGQVLNFSKEHGQRFAVLFLDLDRFKFINDSLGHHVGDEFLKLVSERLKRAVRETDTISRLAGDEFTILFPGVSHDEIVQVAEHINQIMTEPFQVEGHSVTVSASIGIAFYDDTAGSVHQLIRNADTAMYHTKKFKKNSYTIYSKEMDLKATYKLTIERDLKFAIDNNELELFYQPIIDLKHDRITSLEALIRWHHPTLGLVPPADFISVAEESGQIIAIGAWVLQTACRQLRSWQESGVPPFRVSVNISTKQLQKNDFVHSVIDILDRAGLEPKWLELEVTESILLDEVELVKDNLLRLKDAGISISIDDFGTGYTSLSYLRQYPFDKVKIDRCFIDDISRDLNGKRIASAIISLAHSLNMNVLAEGIENEVQLKYLLEESCDEGQGYFFSRPLPAHLLEILSSKP